MWHHQCVFDSMGSRTVMLLRGWQSIVREPQVF